MSSGAGDGPPAAPAADLSLEALEARLPHRSLVRRVLFSWRHKFTAGGQALTLILIGAGAVASGLGIHFPLYHFALGLLATFCVGQGVGFLLRPRVAVERRLPERCAAGASVVVTARVTNTSRLPVYDLGLRDTADPPLLAIDDDPELLAALAPGASASLSYRVTPTRRGAYDFPGPQVFTAFPFGFFRNTRTLAAPHRLLVTPRFRPIDAIDLPVGRRHQPGGLQLVSHVGDSEEFIGNREYRPGDRLRDLHHAAWARVGRPIVREFQQEYLSRIAMVVDTWLPREAPAARRELEAGISLGAAVADALSRQEYVVDIFAAGPDLYHFQAGRSLAYLDDILDVLACIDACPRNPFATLTPAILEELDQISTAVVILLDWDDDRQAFVRALGERGVEAKVLVVRDRAPTRDPSGAPAPVTLLGSAQVEAGVDRL